MWDSAVDTSEDKMDKRELSEVLETIDILKAIAKRGREEISHFAEYMIAWGAYIFFNLLMEFLVGRGFWVETLFLPPMFVMAGQIGAWKSILVWIWGYPVMYGTYILTHNVVLSVVMTAIFFVFATTLSYRMSGMDSRPIRYTLSPYIGITWGVIWASIFFILALFPSDNSRQLLWFTYGAGIGLFITGLLNRYFLYMGLYTLFILPLVLKFIPHFFTLAYSMVGLGMIIAGLSMRRKNN